MFQPKAPDSSRSGRPPLIGSELSQVTWTAAVIKDSCLTVAAIKATCAVETVASSERGHGLVPWTPAHSLALFMRLISFSSLIARVMSPLICSFPDIKARVGFSFPETTGSHHGDAQNAWLPWLQHQTCAHLQTFY